MPASGPQRVQLVQAMLHAFSLDDLEKLLSERFDLRLDVIAEPGAWERRFDQVISWFDRRSRLSELLAALVAERPKDPALAACARAPASPAAMPPPAAPVAAGPAHRLLRPQVAADDPDGLPPDLDEFVLLKASDTLGYNFYIGKYPVTNAQYRRFVEDGGYGEGRWWWRQQTGEVEVLDPIHPGWRAGPRFWKDAKFNGPAQPVVGVSWYEARAYCDWLMAKLLARSITSGEEVRLPTVTEWGRAVRNTHGREYPWGSDTFHPARANTRESGLGQTTPVDEYPGGVTPEGIWDLAGNVWEWMADRDKDGMPWIQGGSWYTDKDAAKASVRYGNHPRLRNHFRGFRCAVVPISRGWSWVLSPRS